MTTKTLDTRVIIALAAVCALTFMSLANVVKHPTPLQADVPGWEPVAATSQWDAGWYAEIATHGYWYHPGEQSPVAYFPLFPLVLTALVKLGIDRWIAGTLESLVFGTLAVWVFSRWAKRVLPEHAQTATLMLAVYPFSVYLYGIIYSDGLFLLTVTSAFLLLEMDHPVLATLVGAAATACRPVAIAVVFGLVARSIEKRVKAGQKVRAVELLPLFAVAGLAAWMVYLNGAFGDPLAWVHVQVAPGWAQPPGWQSWLKLEWFRIMFPKVAPLVALRLGTHALITFVALGLLWPTLKRLGWGYGVYCAVVIGIPAVSSKDFQSLGRYVIAGFPIFLTSAAMLDERPKAKRVLLAVFILGFVFCAISFGSGGYIA